MIESYNLSYNSDELTKISDINTAAGVIVTFSASLVPSVTSALEPVGMVATYFGGYLVGLTRENSFYKSKLKNALYDGEYNLEMLITSYYRRDYPSYKEIYESDVEWCPWRYNNGYINQYHAITRYSKSLKIRANKIEPLNYYTSKKNSSNEWELLLYEFKKS